MLANAHRIEKQKRERLSLEEEEDEEDGEDGEEKEKRMESTE